MNEESNPAELQDEELENVSGGAFYNPDGYLIVTSCNSCDYYSPEGGCDGDNPRCATCVWSSDDSGPLVCYNKNRKQS